jgi:hypothetical protein
MAKIVNDATGSIIDYPGPMTMRSPFPYPGYWSAVYPNMVPLLQQHAPSVANAPAGVISAAFEQAVSLANGEFASILTNRMWELGELMTMNPTLKVKGRAGSALGFVPETPYGGKDAVAAKIFEVPVAALIQQVSTQSMAQNSAQSVMNEAVQYRQQLHNLNLQLAELEASTPTQQTIREKNEYLLSMTRAHEVCAGQVHEISMRIAHMQSEMNTFKTVQKEYGGLMKEHDRLVKLVNNSNKRAANATTLANRQMADADAAKASSELRLVRSRADNLGVSLSRQAATFGPDLVSDMNTLLNIKKKELKSLEKEIKSCQSDVQRLVNQRADGVRSGQTLWSNIKLTSAHIKKTDNSIANAKESLGGLTDIDTTKLVKVWMDHMKSVKEEVVSLLFADKTQSQSGLTDSPLTRFYDDMYDPGTMQDYTEFNAALTDIGDILSNEEYDLLEQIGRLGLSMDYVPGQARIIALSELNKKDRLKGYRNLIEEILSQGQRLSAEDQYNIYSGVPGVGPIFIEDESDLLEVKKLVRHLAESQLNFKYRSGNQ